MSAALFAAFVAAAGTGCAAFFGPDTIPLSPKLLQGVSLDVVGGGANFCPTAPARQLHVVATYPGRKTYETWFYEPAGGTHKDGKIDFDQFTWTASVGTISADGRYVPPANGLALLDQVVTVRATAKANPQLTSEISLTPTYDCGAVITLTGADGADGSSGMDGLAGSDGSSGDPPGDGGRGGDGDNGGDGSAGGPGPAVQVAIGLVASPAHGSLVLARITRAGAPARYVLLDPKGRPLSVKSIGGRGGAGGTGGRGGHGGSGGSNTSTTGGASGSSGSSGSDGHSGYGGYGGRGGTIVVRIDRAHPELAGLVLTDTHGGPGGAGSPAGAAGPPAQVEAADASALFFEEIARGVPIVIQ